jgi:putative transposase
MAADPVPENASSGNERNLAKIEAELSRRFCMKKSKFMGEQIAFALRQAEVCRKIGVSEATYYRWKQLYGGPGPSELRKMRQLDEENQNLKRTSETGPPSVFP